MCRLSGRHGTYSIAGRTSVNTGLGHPCRWFQAPTKVAVQSISYFKSKSETGVTELPALFACNVRVRCAFFAIASVGRQTVALAQCGVRDTLALQCRVR